MVAQDRGGVLHLARRLHGAVLPGGRGEPQVMRARDPAGPLPVRHPRHADLVYPRDRQRGGHLVRHPLHHVLLRGGPRLLHLPPHHVGRCVGDGHAGRDGAAARPALLLRGLHPVRCRRPVLRHTAHSADGRPAAVHPADRQLYRREPVRRHRGGGGGHAGVPRPRRLPRLPHLHKHHRRLAAVYAVRRRRAGRLPGGPAAPVCGPPAQGDHQVGVHPAGEGAGAAREPDQGIGGGAQGGGAERRPPGPRVQEQREGPQPAAGAAGAGRGGSYRELPAG
mmetsp:Transcript_13318/g.34206  ORF Transcript_13318/g.34206 Transcript_13318/m.34206 type:complete len:279 (+) Transcript_13318:572-1408(+)